MKKPVVDIITLGCSKNLVDSEKLIRQLELNGFSVTHDAENPKGEIAVINTCGFIGDAKEESINMILEMAQRKVKGNLKQLIVMGCLSERYLHELEGELPEVDRFYGKFDWERVITDLDKTYYMESCNSRRITTPSHYAYLKISEGCNRTCSYCAIPIITGAHKSRPIEDVLAEVEELVQQGVKEFQVIAQELTYYGLDLYKERKIAELVERIAQTPGVEWIRLHYAYPTQFPMDLLKVMAKYDNVCKYLDIALQHCSDNVLANMHRNITKEQTYTLLETIRREVPGIYIRTTLMVGYPGETDEDFAELIDFIKWAKFERMGAFAYSEEDGTYAAEHYTDDVPQDVKQARLSKLMRVQQNISLAHQENKIGKQYKVIIDRLEGDYYIGRTEYDSPEVDPEILIRKTDDTTLQIGEFYNVEVDSAEEFDLYAHVV
ncbi:MAG: 30S ribosomal protein S12 methylthiotransferase RimO [Bacteroidaceae bacterium]|nr:30S ribosomal protein S12 methylthiotransferase RimO [Bacteroidaceae bacterium]